MRCSAGGGRTQSRLCAWCRLSAGKVGKHCGAVPPAMIALMPHHPRQYEEVSLSHPAKKGTKKSVKRTFTDEERAAMKERVRELKAPEADAESAVLAKIAARREPDRALGKRLHAIIKASAPALSPRLWYGMPAYAKDDKVVCFFQSAQKFKTRYATFGFSDKAHLDEGALWPTAFALKELTAAVEARIAALVKKAVT